MERAVIAKGRPHGHHIVMKGDRYPENAEARAILCEKGINPYCGCENLAITTNTCHSKAYAVHVLETLQDADEKKKSIPAALKSLAQDHQNCDFGKRGGVANKNDELD